MLAYGGAQLFVEFMAEMRRPHDFIKGHGQCSYQISYQGVSIYAWQTFGNMLAVLSGLTAAGLYGNIAIKVLYNNVLMDLFNAPPLNTRTGKFPWAAIVPVWWSLAFIIAAAIPDYFGFVSMQFSESF